MRAIREPDPADDARRRRRPGAVIGAADGRGPVFGGGVPAAAGVGVRERERRRAARARRGSGVGSSSRRRRRSSSSSAAAGSSRRAVVVGRRRRRPVGLVGVVAVASGSPGVAVGARPSASARRRSSSRMNSSNRSPIARSLGRIARGRIGGAGPHQRSHGMGNRTRRTVRLRASAGAPRRSGGTRQHLVRDLVRAGASRRAPAPSGTRPGSRAGSATAGCRPRAGRAA